MGQRTQPGSESGDGSCSLSAPGLLCSFLFFAFICFHNPGGRGPWRPARWPPLQSSVGQDPHSRLVADGRGFRVSGWQSQAHFRRSCQPWAQDSCADFSGKRSESRGAREAAPSPAAGCDCSPCPPTSLTSTPTEAGRRWGSGRGHPGVREVRRHL